MMSKKNLVRWAVIMLVVFGLITVAYPLIFKPGDQALPQNTSPKPDHDNNVAPAAEVPAHEPQLPPPSEVK